MREPLNIKITIRIIKATHVLIRVRISLYRNSRKVAIKQQQANDRRDIIYAPRFQRVNRINAEPRNSRLKHGGPFEMKISRKFIAVGQIDRVDWNE